MRRNVGNDKSHNADATLSENKSPNTDAEVRPFGYDSAGARGVRAWVDRVIADVDQAHDERPRA